MIEVGQIWKKSDTPQLKQLKRFINYDLGKADSIKIIDKFYNKIYHRYEFKYEVLKPKDVRMWQQKYGPLTAIESELSECNLELDINAFKLQKLHKIGI